MRRADETRRTCICRIRWPGTVRKRQVAVFTDRIAADMHAAIAHSVRRADGRGLHHAPASTKLPLMHALRTAVRASAAAGRIHTRAFNVGAGIFTLQMRQALDAQGRAGVGRYRARWRQALFAGT